MQLLEKPQNSTDSQTECPKCCKVVTKQEMNLYYGICNNCVTNGGRIG